jgi:hypothetical protein
VNLAPQRNLPNWVLENRSGTPKPPPQARSLPKRQNFRQLNQSQQQSNSSVEEKQKNRRANLD